MSGKAIMVFALLAALLVSAASPGEAAETNSLQQLLANRVNVKGAAGRQEPVLQPHSAQTKRRAHLSEDEREIMSKQIMQAISEVMNSECMSDRDYQGWLDFGRRDTE